MINTKIAERGETSASEIVRMLKKQRRNLATAESCTGGLISAKITDIPGASDVFSGGFITYSNEFKEKYLHVSPSTLKTHGAVSRECAMEMVEGLLSSTGADCGIAVTGIAGPGGGSKEKPVGLVWIAVKAGGELSVTENHFSGSRERVREQTCCSALNNLGVLLRDSE